MYLRIIYLCICCIKNVLIVIDARHKHEDCGYFCVNKLSDFSPGDLRNLRLFGSSCNVLLILSDFGTNWNLSAHSSFRIKKKLTFHDFTESHTRLTDRHGEANRHFCSALQLQPAATSPSFTSFPTRNSQTSNKTIVYAVIRWWLKIKNSKNQQLLRA